MSDVEESDGDQEMHGNGYAKDGFVVDSDGSEDSDENIFEERSLPPSRARPIRPVGPPISRDAQAAADNDAHQFMVEDFEAEASRMAEEIKNDKNLQRPIFSLQNIRDMALKWTLSLDEMKGIPNIDAAKVDRYGRTFLPIIKKFHDQYKEMMGPAAADHSIIDLVSSDAEMMDFDLEEVEGENSRFFGDPEPERRPQPQRAADVVAFHSNLDDMMKNSQASSSRTRSSPGPKGRGGKAFGRGKKSYPRRSSGGYAKGGKSSAGVAKKKAPSRRQANGPARSASSVFLPNRSGHGGGRGGGGGGSQATIGLMPL